MHAKGHMGLSLAIIFSIMSILRIVDFNSLTTAIFVVVFSTIPDIDLNFEIRHRGPTHNILAAVIFGLIFGILFEYSKVGFWMGFVGGFGGTILHLLGDLLTYQPFAPLAPFCKKEVSLKLFRSSNRLANKFFLNLGSIVFMAYMLFTFTDAGWTILDTFQKMMELLRK